MSAFPEDKDVSYAFNVIKDFFSDIDLYEAVKDIEQLVCAAASNKLYTKRIPGSLLFFKDRFEQLMAAAFIISASYEEREWSVIDFDDKNSSPEISRLNDFVPALRYLPPWAAFPRSLTRRQYFNPYKAVRKFTACMTEHEWKKALKTIVEYALTNDPVDGEYPAHKIMKIRLRMLQLVEACHLLHVRTNLKEKTIKNKLSKSKKK